MSERIEKLQDDHMMATSFMSWGGRLLLAFILSLALYAGLLASRSQTVEADSYNCVSPHCYGIVDWSDRGTYPVIGGAYTSIEVVNLGCVAPACQSGRLDFIDNELWVLGVKHTQQNTCVNINQVGCWVEAGYLATTPYRCSYGTSMDYFWADWRPGDKITNFHCVAPVDSGDYGHYTDFDIFRIGSNEFQTTISSQTHYYSNLFSRNNTMVADDINIGQELQGSSGESAPSATFEYNYFVDPNGVAHIQQLDGVVEIKPTNTYVPVNAYWYIPPSKSTIGGEFITYCTC